MEDIRLDSERRHTLAMCQLDHGAAARETFAHGRNLQNLLVANDGLLALTNLMPASVVPVGVGRSQETSGMTGDGISQEGGLRRALLAGLAAVDEPQPCNGRTMWLVIGLLTLSSPLAILLTQVRGPLRRFCQNYGQGQG